MLHACVRLRALLEALTAAGFAVQLLHKATETSWESHGFVSVLSEDGEELARNESVQHNRNYSEREKILADMAQAVIDRLGSSAGAGASLRTSSL